MRPGSTTTTLRPKHAAEVSLLTVQPARSTRSGSLITLSRPSTPKLKISDRSFHHKAPAIWNSLPAHLRQPASSTQTSYGPGLLALSRPQFLAQLKTHLFPSILSSVGSRQCSQLPSSTSTSLFPEDTYQLTTILLLDYLKRRRTVIVQ